MNKPTLAGFLIVILVTAVPIFGHLSELPMQIWDESRLAVKAFEMSKTGNWIVTTLHWNPDMGSTKPPLNIWIQVLSMKVFGVNELATRLPSAIAALLTCLLMYWFLAIKENKLVAGIASVMILIVSKLYVNIHGIRTGDYDSLLTLFTTAYIISYYLFLKEKKSKYLLATGLLVVGATMTKCVQGVMFLPALLLMTFFFKRFKSLITNKYLYVNIGMFLFVVVGYYLIREQYNPGFLEAASRNEFGGRYFEVLEYHDEPWYHYIQVILTKDPIWVLFAIWGINNMVTSTDENTRRLSGYLSCILLLYIIILSCAQTKLYWYMMPAYPIIAMLASFAIYDIYLAIKRRDAKKRFLVYLLPIATIFTFYCMDYSDMMNRVLRPEFDIEVPRNSMISYYHNEGCGKAGIDSSVFLFEEWAQDFVWYQHKLSTKYNVRYSRINDLVEGDKVVLYNDNLKQRLKERCEVLLLEQYYAVEVYRIIGKKEGLVIAQLE